MAYRYLLKALATSAKHSKCSRRGGERRSFQGGEIGSLVCRENPPQEFGGRFLGPRVVGTGVPSFIILRGKGSTSEWNICVMQTVGHRVPSLSKHSSVQIYVEAAEWPDFKVAEGLENEMIVSGVNSFKHRLKQSSQTACFTNPNVRKALKKLRLILIRKSGRMKAESDLNHSKRK